MTDSRWVMIWRLSARCRSIRRRVFAMGFGNSPNRFLLDKITEYGRGEE
jgi:hypothetical protein